MKPKMLPGPTVPKKSPMRFPNAQPHAAAGPNSSDRTGGMALAGRISVMPGMMGIALKGISTAA